MLNETLCIELADAEGALMRLIGTVERRGFTIATLEKSQPADGRSAITLGLTPRDGVRSMDVLIRQIGRLVDVHAVFTPQIAAAAGAAAAHAPHRWSPACPPRN